MSFTLQCFLAFGAMFACDACWAFWSMKVQQRKAFAASAWALFLFLTSAVATISYVENKWLLIPAALGAFLGTFFAIIWDKYYSNPDFQDSSDFAAHQTGPGV